MFNGPPRTKYFVKMGLFTCCLHVARCGFYVNNMIFGESNVCLICGASLATYSLMMTLKQYF